MARKESVTKQMILDAAFEMAGENGYREVTARKLANHIGCSTQPIFRVYTGMEQLQEDYIDRAVEFFGEFYAQYPGGNEEPFVDLGMAYITFAGKYRHLFELLFLSQEKNRRPLYEILNGHDGNVTREFQKAEKNGCKDAEGLFMKMWMFIHGAACMTMTGDYDLSESATTRLLISIYYAFTNNL